jgi:vacuolar protein sorting-associated protein 3
VLCNWTVTFYSLPELSPALETSSGPTQVKNCNGIGGVDLNEPVLDDGSDQGVGVAMLLSLNRRIRVALIGDNAARPIKVCPGLDVYCLWC